MNRIQFFPLLLFALLGCQSKPERTGLPVWPIAEMMKHPQTENLEEKAAEVKRIPLETSDRILIRTVDALAEADGLWFAKHENQCSVFDSDGNYLHDIGCQGEGPNEYLKLDHFFLKEGNVYLYEAEKEIVRIFTPEGAFIRDFPTGESYNAVCPYRRRHIPGVYG